MRRLSDDCCRLVLRQRPGLAPAGDSLSLASPRESKQREGDPQSGSLRFAPGNLRCSIPAGVRRTRFAQTTAALIPPPSALLSPARTGQAKKRIPNTNTKTSTRQSAYLRSSAVGISFPPRSGWAEERRARRIRARACLSEASLHETPPGPSTARCPVAKRRGPRLRVAFLLGTFLWRSKEKCLARRGESRPPTSKRPALGGKQGGQK